MGTDLNRSQFFRAGEGATVDLFSDSSSDLSSPPQSPIDPRTYTEFSFSYPSPPASQLSNGGTPPPDAPGVTASQDGAPPAKRRRVAKRMPRDTKNLNLEEISENGDPEQKKDLERLLTALRDKRKIVVIAGAGISVSAGIPDFRSSTGLFNSLKAEHKLKGSGKHLFDAAVYRDDSSTTSFHQMVRSLSTLTKAAQPTPFHHMLARLAKEDRLLRLYSQNVDGIDTSLEPLATQVPLPLKGPWPKTIQLHGGLEKMYCIKCRAVSDFDSQLFEGPIPPDCKQCQEMDIVRTEMAGKRSHGIGRLRPRMVLYNEHNPDEEAIGKVTRADMRTRPDAVIVVGTSLKIPGVKRIVREMCSIVKNRRDGLTVWINNDPVPSGKEFENCWDLIVKGRSDEVADLANLKQWNDDSVDEVKEITEEEVNKVKENTAVQVVVETPSKMLPFRNIEGIPTPLESPRTPSRMGAEPPPNAEPEKVTEAIKLRLVMNPASQGPKISEVLKQAPKKNTTKKATKASTTTKDVSGKKSSATTKKAPAKPRTTKRPASTQAPKTAANKKINQAFKLTKGTTTAQSAPLPAIEAKPSKPQEPASPPTPQKEKMGIAFMLNPVSPNPVRFPNLKPAAGASEG